MKPTYGRVSRYGLVAYASSLDQIGPLTRDVTDCANILNIIAGHDEMDSTSSAAEVPDYTKALVEDVKGLKIGLPKEYFVEGMDRRSSRLSARPSRSTRNSAQKSSRSPAAHGVRDLHVLPHRAG